MEVPVSEMAFLFLSSLLRAASVTLPFALKRKTFLLLFKNSYRVTRGKVGGGEKSVIFYRFILKTRISLTIYSTALVKNAKTKPNACSLLENYQNLKIFDHLRAMEAQSWVKKFNFLKEKNSARYFRNNGQTISLMKKYQVHKIDSSFIVVPI